MAQRIGFSMPAFHIANIVLHLLPCVFVLLWASAPVSLAHTLVAALIHLSWGMFASSGTMQLDGVYCPLPRATWAALWSFAVVAELTVMPALTALLLG